MNLVSFWQQQIDKWNTDTKCGFCWDFSAPLIESATNIVQPTPGKECCVKVMFLQDKQPAFSTSNAYSNQTGLLNSQTCSTSFQLLVVIDSKLGLNNYNEVKGHSTEESRWETILQRLQECLSCDANLDFCTFLGSTRRITSWSGQQVINYNDSNYCGYRINVTFQNVN